MKVEYIDHMGSDISVVNAARVSFNKQASNYTDARNKKLIQYLAQHKHEIPFAHTAITLRVTAPISIRTQCFKHKIGFVENEISRRYISTPPELFIPEFRTKPKDSIKQGSDKPHPKKEAIKLEYMLVADRAIDAYNQMIEDGVAPEQARFILPQGVMTTWIWTGSLLAFARFYNLRSDAHAQEEIQELAKQVDYIINPLFPTSWQALTNNN